MKRSFFVVVDGIDGSGKSRIVQMLKDYFSKKNIEVLATREPTDSECGKQIRRMLASEKDPMSSSRKLVELFIRDREQHLGEVIEPFLSNAGDKAKLVICDRYYYSTISFQGAQGLDVNELVSRNKDFRKPDIAFILDVEPDVAMHRLKERKLEKFEQIGIMKRIRSNFLELPSLMDDNIKIIDSSRPLHEVFEEIKEEIENLLD